MSEHSVASPLAAVALEREVQEALEKVRGMGVKVADEVRGYLLRFPDMVQATVQVCEIVRCEVPDAHLSLEVYRDPEIDDEHLILYARFPRYDATVLQRIEGAESQWEPYLVGKKGWLLVTTDFRAMG